MKNLRRACVIVAVFFSACTRAEADPQLFELEWSGVPFGNTASATGFVILDPTLIQGGGGNYYGPVAAGEPISSATITVTGAPSGQNGTFNSFSEVVFEDPGNSLNFNEQLVGQMTAGAPFDSTDSGAAGDFNFFAPDGPYGTDPFTLSVDGEEGELLQLESALPVPEIQGLNPALPVLFLVGGLAVLLDRRIRRRVSALA